MDFKIIDNPVDLCSSCEYNYENCPAKEGDYLFGCGNNICTCRKYRAAGQEETSDDIQGEFNIGEEVRNAHGTTSIVVGFTKDGFPVLSFANAETKRPSFYIYDEHESIYSPIKKTGKTFPGFAEILREMRNRP